MQSGLPWASSFNPIISVYFCFFYEQKRLKKLKVHFLVLSHFVEQV